MTITEKQVKQIEYAILHGLTLWETAAYTGASLPSVKYYRNKMGDVSVYQDRPGGDTKHAYFLLDFLAGTDEPLDDDAIYKHICGNRSGAAPKKDDLSALLHWLEEINIVSAERHDDKIKYRRNDAPWM